MNGYFKDPDATKNAFSGEWLKTGDVGVFDKDDYFSYYRSHERHHR